VKDARWFSGGNVKNDRIRGARLGAQSLESDAAIDYSMRKNVDYVCGHCGAETSLIFATDAESPYLWDCSRCSEQATLKGAKPPAEDATKAVKEAKTPFEMLLERRSRDELEEILTERLAYLRSRRGAGLEDLAG
jgi:ribosomal protein L37AE/L43A